MKQSSSIFFFAAHTRFYFASVMFMPCASRAASDASTFANSASCRRLMVSSVAAPRCATTFPTKLSWSCVVRLPHCEQARQVKSRRQRLMSMGHEAAYEVLRPREVDVGDGREVPHGPAGLIGATVRIRTVNEWPCTTYPDGVVRVVVRALGQVERRLRRRVVRAAALVVVVHGAAVALEVGCQADREIN